jgi:hypothetical protein
MIAGNLFGSDCKLEWSNGDRYTGSVSGDDVPLAGEPILKVTRPVETPLCLADLFRFGVPHGKVSLDCFFVCVFVVYGVYLFVEREFVG